MKLAGGLGCPLSQRTTGLLPCPPSFLGVPGRPFERPAVPVAPLGCPGNLTVLPQHTRVETSFLSFNLPYKDETNVAIEVKKRKNFLYTTRQGKCNNQDRMTPSEQVVTTVVFVDCRHQPAKERWLHRPKGAGELLLPMLHGFP